MVPTRSEGAINSNEECPDEVGSADMGENRGQTAPEYPEQWKRERLLWFVYEWIQEHQDALDFEPEISVGEVQGWGERQEGLTPPRR